MTRTTKIASRWSAAEEPVYSLWSDIDRIVNNRFEPVTINDVNVTGGITSELQQLTITGVQRKVGSKWMTLKNRQLVRVSAGSIMHLRVNLQPSGKSTSTPQRLALDLTVPAKAQGAFGDAFIAGNGFDPNRGAKATSLEQYLDQLSARPGDNVVSGELRFRHPTGRAVDSATAHASVDGRFFFEVRVTK
jgi:hypothetical protein